MKFFNCLLLIIPLSVYACDKGSEFIDTIPPIENENGSQTPPWDPEYYNVNRLSLYSLSDVIKDVKYALSFDNWYSEKDSSSVMLNIEDIFYEFNTTEIKGGSILTASYKDKSNVIKIRKDSLVDLFQKEEDFKIQYHVKNPTNILLNYDTLIARDKIICSGGSREYNNVLSFTIPLKHKNPVFLISFENIDRNGASISINGVDESNESFYRHRDEGTLHYEYMSFNPQTNDFKLKLFRTYREDEGVTLLETIPTTTGDTTTQISFNSEIFTVKVSIRNNNYNRIIVIWENVPIDGVNQELGDWGDGGDGTFIFDL
ncbi:hypothetical protein EZS27_022831 [termite gut metagenome]|uniref:Uncharacterized protein n=1 Tax=termite gut metagenome TaxID=433724 RepID=A0A5J4R6M2_9ZZZZ